MEIICKISMKVMFYYFIYVEYQDIYYFEKVAYFDFLVSYYALKGKSGLVETIAISCSMHYINS